MEPSTYISRNKNRLKPLGTYEIDSVRQTMENKIREIWKERKKRWNH